jgi:hypothetical protein
MKKFYLFLTLAIIICLFACGPTVEQAIKYNDDIITKTEDIKSKMNALTESYDKFVNEQSEQYHAEALKTTKEAIAYVSNLEPFDNDTSLKAGALVLFKTYESVLEVEHKRLIELMKLPDIKYGEKEVAEYDKTRGEAIKKIDVAIGNMIEIQKQFAKMHKFKFNEE